MADDASRHLDQLTAEVKHLYESGRYKDALPAVLEAAEIARREPGEESREYADSLNSLGMIYMKLGKYRESEPLHTSALEILSAREGEENEQYAGYLLNLAHLYIRTGRLAEAEEAFGKALEIQKITAGENSKTYAITLRDRGDMLYWKGEYPEAEKCIEQAMDILQASVGDSDPEYARCLLILAGIDRRKRDMSSAVEKAERAVEILRATLGENHPALAQGYTILAITAHRSGDLPTTVDLFKKTLEIFRHSFGEEHGNYGIQLNNLGTLYWETGNYTEAEEYLKGSIENLKNFVGEDHLQLASPLGCLGSLCITIGEYERAEEFLNRAMEILQKSIGEKDERYGMCLVKKAELHLKRGNYTDAETGIKNALEVLTESLGEKGANPACLSLLAEIYHETGRYEDANTELKKVFDTIGELKGYEQVTLNSALRIRTRNHAASGRVDEAMSDIVELNSLYDKYIPQIIAIASERHRISYLSSIQDALDLQLSMLRQSFADSPENINSTLDLILRRKAISAEALSIQQEAVLGGKYPELKEKLDELTSLRRQIAWLTFRDPGPGGQDEMIRELNSRKDAVESEIARGLPEFGLEEKLRDADRKAVAQKLPDDSTLIEFVRFREYDFNAVPAKGESEMKGPRYLAFLVHAGQPDDIKLVDLGDAGVIDKMISEFRSSIIGEPDIGESRSVDKPEGKTVFDGISLREILFDKLAKSFDGCTRLLIAPDGDLNRLPFEVLPTDDGRYLIDDYQISYLSVGRDLLRIKTENIYKPGVSFVIADPDFDFGCSVSADQPEPAVTGWRHSKDIDRTKLKFEPLPGTRPEGEAVSEMLGVKPILESDVLESTIKSVESPRVMHIATHGFFLPDQSTDAGDKNVSSYENPLLRSGLALAGANNSLQGETLPDEAEDGILTAEDVSGLDLLGTELVVLSACDTGLGVIHAGEGVFGMRRAFILAGTKTLVMSLWKVPDLATPILMERFYTNMLERGLGRDESLREAQKYTRDVTLGEIKSKWLSPAMIDQLSGGDDRAKHKLAKLARRPDDIKPFDNPLYWGAFICQGNPNPLNPT